MIEDLRAHPKNLPTTVKRLSNHVASLLGIESTDQEALRVLDELKRMNVLAASGTKPDYKLKK